MNRFVLDNSVAMRWFMPSDKAQDQTYAREVLSSFSSADKKLQKASKESSIELYS